MKYKTFESLLLNCKELYDEAVKRDKTLQDALGGDTQIMTEWWSKYIEKTIDSIQEEFGDKNETVDWLFWESMCSSSGYMDFVIDDVTYIGNIENVWMDLTGILDERFGKSISSSEDKSKTQESTILSDSEIDEIINKELNPQLSKEEIVNAHDKDKLENMNVKNIIKENFSTDKEFYDYIKYLFECNGINITEVDTPSGNNYKTEIIYFDSEDFNSKIKELIYEKNIFSICLYSAGFIENDIKDRLYSMQLDWKDS